MCGCMLSCFSRVWLCDPWTVAHTAPLSMGFPRQDYWIVLPHPPPGDLPHPGIKPTSCVSTLAGRFLTTLATWEAPSLHMAVCYISPKSPVHLSSPYPLATCLFSPSVTLLQFYKWVHLDPFVFLPHISNDVCLLSLTCFTQYDNLIWLLFSSLHMVTVFFCSFFMSRNLLL